MTTPSFQTKYLKMKLSKRPYSRLYIFSSAGGSVSQYNRICKNIGDNAECIGLEYPGRGIRPYDPLIRSVRELARDAYSRINTDIPYVLFGHSLGSLVAYETCCILERNNRPKPTLLVVSAKAAPGIPLLRPSLYRSSDEDILNYIRSLDGTSNEFYLNKELMDMVIPVLRADMEAVETYSPDFPDIVSTPVLALGGYNDQSVSENDLRQWEKVTRSFCGTKMYPGGHFYIWDNQNEIDKIIACALESKNSQHNI